MCLQYSFPCSSIQNSIHCSSIHFFRILPPRPMHRPRGGRHAHQDVQHDEEGHFEHRQVQSYGPRRGRSDAQPGITDGQRRQFLQEAAAPEAAGFIFLCHIPGRGPRLRDKHRAFCGEDYGETGFREYAGLNYAGFNLAIGISIAITIILIVLNTSCLIEKNDCSKYFEADCSHYC